MHYEEWREKACSDVTHLFTIGGIILSIFMMNEVFVCHSEICSWTGKMSIVLFFTRRNSEDELLKAFGGKDVPLV